MEMIARGFFAAVALSLLTTVSCQEEQCVNPFGGLGYCTVLFRCGTMMNYLRTQRRPWSMTVKNILRTYHCGFDGLAAMTCCSQLPNLTPNGTFISYDANNLVSPNAQSGNVGNRVPTVQRVDDSSVPSPPQVETHRNLALLPECQYPGENRVYGGNSTTVFEYPWMALLIYDRGGVRRFSCGGTIVNDQYILTAAHCVNNLGTAVLTDVRVGEHDLRSTDDCEGPPGAQECSDGVQDIPIAEVITHPGYIGVLRGVSRLQNDIALVRLARRIDFSKNNVASVCLPTTQSLQQMNLEGQKLVIAGWGSTEKGVQSPELLQADIPVIPQSQCALIHRRSTEDGISHTQMCAGGERGIDSCSGDSGGPLMMFVYSDISTSIVQYGIVSYGPRMCGTSKVPGVYTRVAYFMDWILDQLRP